MKKKIIYILIALIISVLTFFVIQTNRVYIKAVLNSDSTVKLTYTDYNGKKATLYQRAFKKGETGEVTKIKFRIKANVKSMNLSVTDGKLEVKKVSIISLILPYNLKTFEIPKGTFTNILIIRMIATIIFGFLLSFIILYLIKCVDKNKNDLWQEKFMIFLLVFIFCFPVLTMWLPLQKIELFNIVGESVVYDFPKFSFKSYIDKSYQSQFENWLNKKLMWNALYIKLFNTLNYVAFDKSYSSNGGIIIGKDKYLYEMGYIQALFPPNVYDKNSISEKETLNNLNNTAKDLKQIQDYLIGQGKTFIFVITPSKADFDYDKIPDRFELNPDKTKSYQAILHNAFVSYLKENNVNYVSMPDYIKEHNKEMKPVYTKGGIHWNDYGKFMAASAIIEELNKVSKYKFDYPKIQQVYTNEFPRNEDRDLITVLNLLYFPKNHDVENIIYEPNKKEAPDVRLKVVGGSFCAGFLDSLTLSHTFKNADYFFYINKKFIDYRNYLQDKVLSENEINEDIPQRVQNSIDTDILILELNDNLLSADKGHLQTFISEMKKIMK